MMVDISLFQFIGSIGGVGAVFALLMFFVYQNAVKQIREDRKFMEDRLTNIICDYHTVVKERNEVMMKHTQVLSELTTWLRASNGKR